MLNKIKAQLKPDKLLLKGGLIVFIGSMAVNVTNYLFHLAMGRSLGPTEYGVAVAIISFLALLSIPLSTVSTVVAKFTSEAMAKNQKGEIAYLFYKLSKYLSYIGIGVIILIIIFANQIGDFLQLNSIYIKVISIFLIFALLVAVTRGMLQGIKSFSTYTINIIIEVALKLGLFLLLFFLGLKTFSVVWALIISVVVAYIVSLFPLKKIIAIKPLAINLKVLLHYSSYALLALSLLSALTYIDVLLVKHYFSPENAGYYAALATAGKIVIFLGSPIILVMFPLISEAYTKKERHFHLLAQTTVVVCILSILVLLIYYFMPQLVIKILYGVKFLAVSSYLFHFGLVMFLLTLANILVYYFLSVRSLKFVWLIFATVILELLLIYLYHQDITQIIDNLFISFGFLFISLFVMYIYLKKERIAKVFKTP